MDLQYIGTLLPSLLSGTVMTLKIFVLTLAFSLPLGLPFALAAISRLRPAALFVKNLYLGCSAARR